MVIDKISQDIILIEDSDTDAYLFKHYLNKLYPTLNLEVINNGEDGLNKLMELLDDSESKHVVFLDLNLPMMTGIEILTELKKKRDSNSLKIIILSGSRNPKDIELCLSLGADEFHLKPYGIDEYINLLKSFSEVL